MNLNELAQIAITAAKQAGLIIKEAAEKDVEVNYKEGGANYASQVVTAIDRQCDTLIRRFLKQTCQEHHIGMLTEEYPDDGSRFERDCFWCVDPLDGTLAFINKEPGFAVSIALISKEGLPLIGVVYNPTTQILYHAIKGKGVFRNEKPWQITKQKKDVFTLISDKALEDTPEAETIRLVINKKMAGLKLNSFREIHGGGAVWNAIRVLEEAPAVMLKAPKKGKGGGSIWDYAATACIFQELGCQATDFHGKRLDLNKETDAFMNHRGVCFISA
jgi:fructose-1,6-bisphosphatase/inositol monophosphatase family enzyme